jgi:hypothetical protein
MVRAKQKSPGSAQGLFSVPNAVNRSYQLILSANWN